MAEMVRLPAPAKVKTNTASALELMVIKGYGVKTTEPNIHLRGNFDSLTKILFKGFFGGWIKESLVQQMDFTEAPAFDEGEACHDIRPIGRRDLDPVELCKRLMPGGR